MELNVLRGQLLLIYNVEYVGGDMSGRTDKGTKHILKVISIYKGLLGSEG